MFTGMMWFDNNPKTTLSEKIARAADYYKEKYGSSPNKCYVNPKNMQVPEQSVVVGTIVIEKSKSVLPGHFWIGVDEKES